MGSPRIPWGRCAQSVGRPHSVGSLLPTGSPQPMGSPPQIGSPQPMAAGVHGIPDDEGRRPDLADALIGELWREGVCERVDRVGGLCCESWSKRGLPIHETKCTSWKPCVNAKCAMRSMFPPEATDTSRRRSTACYRAWWRLLGHDVRLSSRARRPEHMWTESAAQEHACAHHCGSRDPCGQCGSIGTSGFTPCMSR